MKIKTLGSYISKIAKERENAGSIRIKYLYNEPVAIIFNSPNLSIDITPTIESCLLRVSNIKSTSTLNTLIDIIEMLEKKIDTKIKIIYSSKQMQLYECLVKYLEQRDKIKDIKLESENLIDSVLKITMK